MTDLSVLRSQGLDSELGDENSGSQNLESQFYSFASSNNVCVTLKIYDSFPVIGIDTGRGRWGLPKITQKESHQRASIQHTAKLHRRYGLR